jgi:hypothetical protein
MTMSKVPPFETVEYAERLQNDLLRALRTTSIDPAQYKGLADCGPKHCGCAPQCLEVCWLGTRRRRLTEIPAVYTLFEAIEGPIYEVRIIRSSWAQPIGRLQDVNVAAIKQWNRRKLDSLYMPSLVAVGMLKIRLPTEDEAPHWIPEIHQLVTGADEEELRQRFSGETRMLEVPEARGLVEVTPVKSLGAATKCSGVSYELFNSTEVQSQNPANEKSGQPCRSGRCSGLS